jgi:hypothetical protein
MTNLDRGVPGRRCHGFADARAQLGTFNGADQHGLASCSGIRSSNSRRVEADRLVRLTCHAIAASVRDSALALNAAEAWVRRFPARRIVACTGVRKSAR